MYIKKNALQFIGNHNLFYNFNHRNQKKTIPEKMKTGQNIRNHAIQNSEKANKVDLEASSVFPGRGSKNFRCENRRNHT